ncbi:MAG: type II secretion system minor pseudopilin GspK [Syntrophaceae bacterium]|nr:type II secretion system minor pseudopilin GspK [Syntrophaceae bacterium]
MMIIKDKYLNNNKGIALITVILIIVILVAVVIELNRSSRTDIYDAANLSDGIKLTYIAKSGFYGATALLNKAQLNYNSLRDDWANMETISLQSNTLFPEGYFIAKVEDEAGKIPLNKLVNGEEDNKEIREMLTRLLSLPEFGLSEGKVDEILDSIKDWIDANENTTGYGAESSYYSSLDSPYRAKNAPLDCIEELLMVKGITKEIFYGTKDKPSLAQYVTTDSEGLVNINTAPKIILRSLNNRINPDLADRLDEFRMKEGNELSAIQWYKQVPGMEDITINQQLITVKSNYFKITSIGKMNNMSRTITGIVLRENKKSVKILKWRQD